MERLVPNGDQPLSSAAQRARSELLVEVRGSRQSRLPSAERAQDRGASRTQFRARRAKALVKDAQAYSEATRFEARRRSQDKRAAEVDVKARFNDATLKG